MIGKASAQGVVCRANEGRESVAVRYTENDGISDLMQSLQEVARLRTREAVPMFCGSNGEMREVMAELDSLGLRYKRVDRPISALCVLKNPWKPVTTLVFPPSSHWLVFSGLLGTNHPELRRLLVDGGLSPLGAELAVAHSIVDDTWSRARDASGLHEALGISLSGDDCLSCGLPLAVSSSAFCATCLDRSSSLGPQDDLGGCG
jgi:hypothetical protein